MDWWILDLSKCWRNKGVLELWFFSEYIIRSPIFWVFWYLLLLGRKPYQLFCTLLGSVFDACQVCCLCSESCWSSGTVFYCVRLAPWLAFLTFKHELPILNHLPRAMLHNILTFAVLSNSDKKTLANITDKSCENYSQYQTTWSKIDSCSVHS